jgi:4-cresol dehydrogenase (hydroxylating)
MRTPPGLSPTVFATALREFESVVGAQWVFTKDEDTILYRDAYSPYLGEPEERWASAAAAPASTEEVQQIVRIANRHGVPLYPISNGRNLGYGGSAPTYSGCVVLDLKRMNRILEVNEENAYALVEPGVSYFDLYRYIQEKKLKLWVDCPDPGWGSVVGNALDRGSGYTFPYLRNHFDAHCGMEVVLANGELIRTGMGALPAAQTWQQYKSGYGPWIDGMFSQSNFGVVTKMGFWLMPQPEAYRCGRVLVRRRDDLHELIRLMTLLENSGITNGYPDSSSPLLGIGSIGAQARFLAVDEPIPADDPELQRLRDRAEAGDPSGLEAYGQKHGLAYWSFDLKFYGPAKVIAAQWEHAREVLSAIPGAWFEDQDEYHFPLAEEPKDHARYPEFGIPSLNNFSLGARSSTNPTPSHGHMWLSPIIPRTAEAIFEANRVFAEVARKFGLPQLRFSLPAWYWQRSAIFIFGFPVSEDPAQNKRHREAFFHVIEVAAQHGWAEYRTAPAFQDAVAQQFSFNNHSLLRFHETVKDAVDPNGILSPGRYGIWPKHLRKQP